MLPACTRFDGERNFTNLDFSLFSTKEEIAAADEFEFWQNRYHSTVDAIIEESIGERTGGQYSVMRALEEPPLCEAETYEAFLVPQPQLLELSRSLPSWKDGETVSHTDMGTVLLEFLRSYECALTERSTNVRQALIQQDTRRNEALVFLGFPIKAFTRYDQDIEKEGEERRRIAQELTLARRTLHRALTLVKGIDRLRPLDAELTCFQRASLDVRNSMSLAASASSCLPRTWDARDALRDLPPEE